MPSNEIVYGFSPTFQDILDNGSDSLKEFYNKLSDKQKLLFINDNSRSASKGFEFGLCDPIHDVITTVASLLESNIEIVVKELNEGAINERGRTSNGSIAMICTINGYDVSYINERGDYDGEENLSLEEAENLFGDLSEKHPECN